VRIESRGTMRSVSPLRSEIMGLTSPRIAPASATPRESASARKWVNTSCTWRRLVESERNLVSSGPSRARADTILASESFPPASAAFSRSAKKPRAAASEESYAVGLKR